MIELFANAQPFQILVALLMFIGIIRAALLFRQRKLTLGPFIFWIVVWGSIGTIAFIPRLTSWISPYFGIARGVDLIIYLSIIVLFYLVFKISLRLESLERTITLLVREIALRKK